MKFSSNLGLEIPLKLTKSITKTLHKVEQFISLVIFLILKLPTFILQVIFKASLACMAFNIFQDHQPSYINHKHHTPIIITSLWLLASNNQQNFKIYQVKRFVFQLSSKLDVSTTQDHQHNNLFQNHTFIHKTTNTILLKSYQTQLFNLNKLNVQETYP